MACLLGGADAGSVDGVRPQAVHDMMEDRTGSHVLEVRHVISPHLHAAPGGRCLTNLQREAQDRTLSMT